jgi:galactosyl transferase GMA12/MNN10 family
MNRLFFLIIFAFISKAYAKVCVISAAVGDTYKKIVQLGTYNKLEYCFKHGYDFLLAQENLDKNRHVYWTKILLTLKALDNRENDYVVWVDADTLIMNLNTKIEDLVKDGSDFYIAKDLNGINSGVYIIKNTPWAKDFMNNVYARTDCLSHLLPEQTAIALELEKPENIEHALIVPQRFFNSYPKEYKFGESASFQPGDFLIHFPGSGKKLSDYMNHYSKSVQH